MCQSTGYFCRPSFKLLGHWCQVKRGQRRKRKFVYQMPAICGQEINSVPTFLGKLASLFLKMGRKERNKVLPPFRKRVFTNPSSMITVFCRHNIKPFSR